METFNQSSYLSGSFLDSKFFNPEYLFNQSVSFSKQLFGITVNDQLVDIGKTLLFFLTMFFLTIISYSIVRILEIRKKEHNHLHNEIHEYAHRKHEREKKLNEQGMGSKNERWTKTLGYLFSQHASDWKLAVIEADAMLEELISQMGFKGESLGDKLKSANQDNFPHLTKAWEVHNIRNKIAHEGLAFELSQHEAKRIIALYELIFKAYGFI